MNLNGILAAFSNHNNDVVPNLLDALQGMPESAEHRITLATLMGGRIQQTQLLKPLDPEQDFSSLKQSLKSGLSLACIRQKQTDSNVHLATTFDMAVAIHGLIDNLPDIQTQLFQLGYDVDNLSPCDLIRCLIRRYLDIPMPVRDACLTAINRLSGEFALIALFAEQKSLVIAQKGIPMTLSSRENEVYIASNTAGCFVQPLMLLEENSFLILRSFQK